MTNFSYHDYVTDEKFLDDYNEYQKKYAGTMRESDRVLVELVRSVVVRHKSQGRALSLFDIGCSTGNLLLHLKRLLPELHLTGGDLAESSLDQCRSNSALTGIDFRIANILNLPVSNFDIVTVNAVLYMFDEEQFALAMRNINRALSVGGQLIVFDFFHPFEQHLVITETSRSHPDGLRLCFRKKQRVDAQLIDAGFSPGEYLPFTLPIDLPLLDGGELLTYTVKTDDSRRLPFRGALFQPWCHMVSTKRVNL